MGATDSTYTRLAGGQGVGAGARRERYVLVKSYARLGAGAVPALGSNILFRGRWF